MQQKKNHLILFFLCCYSLFLSPLYATENPVQQQVYLNSSVGVSIKGPSGWFLTTRDNASSNTIHWFSDNQALFAIFTSFDLAHDIPSPHTIGMINIYFRPADPELMDPSNKKYTEMRQSVETVVEPPRKMTFNNHEWVVTRSVLPTAANDIKLAQVTYITIYNQTTIQVEALTTETLYQERRALFDDMIKSIAFEKDPNKLTLDAMGAVGR